MTPRVLALYACAVALSGCDREPAPESATRTPEPAAESTPAAPVESVPERSATPAVVDAGLVEVDAGWIAQVSGASGPGVTTLMPSASFMLQPDESLHPRIAPAGMTVEYAAMLDVPTAGSYRLIAEFEGGKASVRCFDQLGNEMGVTRPARVPRLVQTDWMSLTDEPHTVMVVFERNGNATARLRVMWERQGVGTDGFVAEAIPTALVSVPSESRKDAARAMLAMEGRALLGELGCVSCHASDPSTAHAVLPRQAPLLGEIGRRATGDWLFSWISDPQAHKPGSGMPNVFLEPDRAEAMAITNYLVSLGGPSAARPAATEDAVLDEGRRLYHSVGCVSCHGGIESPLAVHDETGLSDEMPAYIALHPFGDLEGKWVDAGALSDFLQEPARTHPGGRMPSMNLSESEADLIATYLVRTIGSAPAGRSAWSYDASQIERGKAAFSARGCANCHETGHNQAPAEPGPMSVELAGLLASKGPMDPNDTVHVIYDLTQHQRDALRAAIEDIQMGAAHPAPLDDATLRMSAMACLTCHTKDERGGLADAIKPYFTTEGEAELGDEGRFPPHLSGVGFKLTTPWLREVLTDAGTARPYMSIRMPQFGDEHVGVLAEHLAAIDGVRPDSDEWEPEATDELVMAGRTLTGEGGLNCISCHVFSDLPPAGTPGPDIARFAERLRYAWWRDYVLNPPRFKPGTRMPLFYYAGRGAVTDVYNGDPHRQAEAMWAYFTLGQFAPVPEGLGEGDGLALRVGVKPVVFRTYLQDAGSRAIAVGFPVGFHYAFDAETSRLIDAWKGEFIDATSAWKGRGGGLAEGQGPVIWSAPDGPTVSIGEQRWTEDAFDRIRFRGYMFDDAHVPVFSYDYRTGDAAARIDERIEPINATSGSFRRQFTIAGHAGRTVWINAGPDVGGVIAVGADTETNGDMIVVTPRGMDSVTVTLEVRP